MQDHPVLGQVALGYSPLINPQRQVCGLRLTVFPEQPDASPDGADLLRALDSYWPTAVAPVQGLPLLSLNIAGEALLRSVMAAQPGSQRLLEVPAFMASDAAHGAALRALQAAGTPLAIKGRPLTPLSPSVLALFSHCILEGGEDRRDIAPAAVNSRGLPSIQAGARSTATADAAFQRGAALVIGWPWDDETPVAAARSAVPTDIKTVMDLINGVEREQPVDKLEQVLRRDPALAFRLMRYLNSPAFGLPVEVTSFSHALMLLGYQRLKRWLALLLVSSATGPNSKVVIHAAVGRGLLMEGLGREHGDAEARSEMFICGVFSLLPTLLRQSMAELLRSVPVPERVQQALRGDGGPYGAYLELVQAIELESVFDIRQRSEALLLGPLAVNRAILSALKAGRELSA